MSPSGGMMIFLFFGRRDSNSDPKARWAFGQPVRKLAASSINEALRPLPPEGGSFRSGHLFCFPERDSNSDPKARWAFGQPVRKLAASSINEALRPSPAQAPYLSLRPAARSRSFRCAGSPNRPRFAGLRFGFFLPFGSDLSSRFN